MRGGGWCSLMMTPFYENVPCVYPPPLITFLPPVIFFNLKNYLNSGGAKGWCEVWELGWWFPLSHKKNLPPKKGRTVFFVYLKNYWNSKGSKNDFRFMICGMNTQLVIPPSPKKEIPPKKGELWFFLIWKMTEIQMGLKNILDSWYEVWELSWWFYIHKSLN